MAQHQPPRKIRCLLCKARVERGQLTVHGLRVPPLDCGEVSAILEHSDRCPLRGTTEVEWWRSVSLERIIVTNGVPFDINAPA